MRISLLFCALGALLGCRTVSEPSGTAIALFCSTYQGAKTESLTVGEEVAVFACPEGTEEYFLEAAKFTVGADGRSLDYGSTVYYPDPKQAVRFFAYFPYHTGTFSVPTDQSTAKALKEADLCGATTSTTPVATPVALAFKHLMAKVVIVQTNKPTEKITFPNAVTSGVVHAATAELVLGAERKDISTTGNELIVPVQPLTRLVLTVANVEYVFDGSVSLEAGKTTTLNLTLHPNTKTATLSGSSVTDWVASSTAGNISQAVSNTLTVHWPKCHPQSNAVDRIVLTIKDEVSKITASHTVKGDFKYSDQTFTIPFASSALHYPYTIASVALYQNNTEWLHESPNVLGGTIIKSGACVVGIRQPLNPPAAADYIVINGLKWAKGNLVAVSKENNQECKVGAPADGGVYFQFGSLIGWKGGNQTNGGTGVGYPQPPLSTTMDGLYWSGSFSWAGEAMVWPHEFTRGNSITTFPSTTTNLYYFGDNTILGGYYLGNYPGLREGRLAVDAVGDPCTYYLGSPWRLPRIGEFITLNAGVNPAALYADAPWSEWGSLNAVPGVFMGPDAKIYGSRAIFLPRSGLRLETGLLSLIYTFGLALSADTAGPSIMYYTINNSDFVRVAWQNPRVFGLPARCVSE